MVIPGNELSLATRALVDGSYPYWMVDALERVRDKEPKSKESSQKYWKSQPRKAKDKTWEVLKYTFTSPASIGELSFRIKKVEAEFEIYYVDRRGQRKRVVDKSQRHLKGTVGGEEEAWYTFYSPVYPIVAEELEIRVKRNYQGEGDPNRLVHITLGEVLIKRTVYTRHDILTGFEPEVDSLGNYVTRTVKDWDPVNVLSDDAYTFWKSEPQPTPDAVVCMYVDVRDEDGNAQIVDRLFLDPVFTGQQLNMYYSTDDTVGTRRLSFSKLPPTEQVDVVWEGGLGMRFGENVNSTSTKYTLPTHGLGVMKDKDIWVGGSFSAFGPRNTSQNTILAIGRSKEGEVTLEATSTQLQMFQKVGTTRTLLHSVNYTEPSNSLAWEAGDVVAWVFGVRGTEDTPRPFIGAWNHTKDTKVLSTSTTTTLDFTPFSQGLSLDGFAGVLQTLALKQESVRDSEVQRFLQDPSLYLAPDPVMEDDEGRLPSTTLDNVLLGSDFFYQELPQGGEDSSFFTSKVWHPIWRDWVVERGYYFFPQPRIAKFLKLEFTNLTEQPYPVWESGLETKYQSFPIEVIKTTTDIAETLTTTQKTTTTSKTTTKTNITNVKGSNKSSSSSKTNTKTNTSTKVNSTTTTEQDIDYVLNVGGGIISDVPHLYDKPVEESFSREVSNESVYRGSTTSTSTQTSSTTTSKSYTVPSTTKVARARYYTVVKGDWLIKIAAKFGVNWRDIHKANQKLIDTDPRIKLLPRRSPGWWIFPGQVIRIPGTVMETITTTKTVTERKKTNVSTTTTVRVDTATDKKTVTDTTRQRFTTTSVHRYDIKTVERDVELAYFAGIRALRVFKVNWLNASDVGSFFVEQYDEEDFTLDNAELVQETGAVVPLNEEPATYAWSGTPNESTSTRTTVDGTVTNLFTNPDMVTTDGDVVVWENLFSTNQVTSLALGTTVLAGNNYRSFVVPVSEGDKIYIARQSVSSNRFRYVFTDEEPAAGVEYFGGTGNSPATDSDLSFPIIDVPADASYLLLYLSNAGEDVDDLIVAKAPAPIPYFNETFSPDPDLTAQPRPGGGSQLVGQQVAGMSAADGVVVQSTQWSKSGGVSARLINNTGANAPFVTASPTVTGLNSRNAQVWRYQDRDGLDEGHGRFGHIYYVAGAGAPSYSNRAPNEAGETLLRVDADTATSTFVLMGGQGLGESVWFDLLTVTDEPVEYDGPPFSGDSPDIGIPSVTSEVFPTISRYRRISIKSIQKDSSTIRFFVSNDGGTNWYDATPVVNRSNHYFYFPKLGNQMRWRVEMNKETDYIFGAEVTPLYEIESSYDPS